MGVVVELEWEEQFANLTPYANFGSINLLRGGIHTIQAIVLLFLGFTNSLYKGGIQFLPFKLFFCLTSGWDLSTLLYILLQ